MNVQLGLVATRPEVQELICPTHGAYTRRIVDIALPAGVAERFATRCQACAEAEQEQRKAKAEAAEHSRRTAEKIAKGMIPPRFRSCTFDNYEAKTEPQKDALAICRGFADSADGSASLILLGRPGNGKTHLACAITNAILDAGHFAQFRTVLQAIRYVKDTYRRESLRSESEAMADLLKPDVLVLDEVGVQMGTEHEKMVFFEIINERYQHCVSTVLVSNLNADDLQKYLGERVMDRFREGGMIVPFTWESYRPRANG